MDVTDSTSQRIPRSRLRLMDTISDSQKASGLLYYQGELGGASVIVKHYRRMRKGWDEIEKVRSGSLHSAYLYI
jgi:hypothetical protein